MGIYREVNMLQNKTLAERSIYSNLIKIRYVFDTFFFYYFFFCDTFTCLCNNTSNKHQKILIVSMENIPNKTHIDYKLIVKTSQTFKSIFLTFISTRFSNGCTSIWCTKNLISEDRLTLGKHIASSSWEQLSPMESKTNLDIQNYPIRHSLVLKSTNHSYA